MSRRTLVGGVSVALFTLLLPTTCPPSAEPRPKVGFVATTPAFCDVFVRTLQELGYQEGRNIAIDWRRAPGGEAPDLEDLIKLKPACLVLPGPLNLLRAQKLTATIPIIAIDL